MPVIHVSNATIEEISSERTNTLVTIIYEDRTGGRRSEQTVRLVVNPRTLILNTNGNSVPVNTLRVGMTVNAAFSSAMTRSIPPQATAYLIEIVRRQSREEITTGRILDINRNNRSFTTVSDHDASSIIRFNTSDSTRFFDRFGRPMDFSGLMPGMRVQVWHANFRTTSIPPQTTAFEVRML